MEIKAWSENAKNGTPILIVNKNGKEFRLNSTYPTGKGSGKVCNTVQRVRKRKYCYCFWIRKWHFSGGFECGL